MEQLQPALVVSPPSHHTSQVYSTKETTVCISVGMATLSNMLSPAVPQSDLQPWFWLCSLYTCCSGLPVAHAVT